MTTAQQVLARFQAASDPDELKYLAGKLADVVHKLEKAAESSQVPYLGFLEEKWDKLPAEDRTAFKPEYDRLHTAALDWKKATEEVRTHSGMLMKKLLDAVGKKAYSPW